jgi:pyruvate dehydrogenase E2 component (dihydrolipoamide acetyltransferase)
MTATAGLVEFKLADVGEGMHEAEILRWLVAPGDMVKADQIIVEIQTDKAVVELPAPISGKIGEIVAMVGTIARVGDVLVRIEDSGNRGQAIEEGARDARRVTNEKPISNHYQINQHPTSNIQHPLRVRAAPAVRKQAVELGIDLTLVKPSSPDGRILLDDVLNFSRGQGSGVREQGTEEGTRDERRGTKEKQLVGTQNPTGGNEEGGRSEGRGTNEEPATINQQVTNEEPSLEPATGNVGVTSGVLRVTNTQESAILNPQSSIEPSPTPQPLRGLRRRIAERMAESWRTIPQVTTFSEVDGEALFSLRQNLKPLAEKRGINLTYMPFVIKAVTLTLKQFPLFNASFDEPNKQFIYHDYYHIGIATATNDGLLVPVVRSADQKSLVEIAAEANRLAEGARARKLTQPELSGSTFTITNVGSFGGDTGTAIINPPEVAILCTGKLQEKAVARSGQVVVRQTMPLALTFDHRLIDGADAGAFMTALKQLLENPSQMLLDLV